jgi:hypothetical protein
VSFFITDVLMAQNGVEFVAGVDTYNGTTAYTSYDTYKRCERFARWLEQRTTWMA